MLIGFSDIETYHLIEKMPEDDLVLSGLFEKFYPLIVPGSGNKQIWVDGVLWVEELDA